MTELKMTIPTGIMWIFIGSILFQGASGLALVWQRHESDMALLEEIGRLRVKNDELRAKLLKVGVQP